MKVEPTIFVEEWFAKSDPARKYPRKSKRVAIKFPFDREIQNELKDALRQMDGYYNLKFSNGGWSIRYDPEVIRRSASILKQKYDVTDLLGMAKDAPVTEKAESITDATASVVRGEIELNWPWIKDNDLRDRVRNIVKGVPNRSWDAGKKVWRIPIGEAGFLMARLNDVYQPLCDAIGSLSEVQTYMDDYAARIAISDAAELDDEEVVAEMRERLAGVFAPGLELYPFQYVGVRFAELAGGRCLIGDDMGIGKTIQAIAYCALHQDQWPVLVICPSNVKYNWAKEVARWLPDTTVEVVNGYRGPIEEADFTVINYDLMAKRFEQLDEMEFGISVLDESHYVKNNKAARTKATLSIADKSDSVLCLSGTAITNRPAEYFTTLNLLRKAQFSSWLNYVRRYCAAYNDGWGWKTGGASNVEELHAVSRDFTIRRLKKEVMAELPDKIRQSIPVIPTKAELKEYRQRQRDWSDEYSHIRDSGRALPAGYVLNMLTDLRHNCGVMKVGPVSEWVLDYKENNERPIVVFAHHKNVVTPLLSIFKLKGLRADTITGEVKSERRSDIVDEFQAGNLDVLVCSTLAAKEGLTLTAADTVVFVEREWVPGWEEQAEDRVNRIGQDAKTVHALYFTVEGTIDEKFNHLIEQKRAVVRAVLDGGDEISRSGITRALLQDMVDAGEIDASILSMKEK
jgi:SWI/SNF-related matrix-associated actin-dependent regulator 1 of chromatin subfamily A